MAWFVGQIRERHLVGAPGAFRRLPIDCLWPRPAFRTAQNDHRPGWSPLESVLARVRLNGPDFREHFVQSASHELVHQAGIIAFHEIRLVTVAAEELLQFLVTDASEDSGI